jgi:GNAT superfamily N-acetyltransferase
MATAQPEGTPKSRASWRALTPVDIESLASIANIIHPGLPESPQVFLERITLFPSGCLALVDHSSNKLAGYAISHPIKHHQPPALDSLLETLHPAADQYYIHDLAILPEWQGKGYAKTCVEQILRVAEGYKTIGLVSVYGTATFWGRFGFKSVAMDDGLKDKLLAYGEDAVFIECRLSED